MENVYGNNAFYWWVGVVEDRNDPLYLGRCKVRIVGHHSSDTGELPVSDLPWAFPMQPITSAAMSGVGQTPIGVVEGTWVIGFFRDGDDCQEPVMMGTMGGIPGKKYQERLNNTTGRGFQDPNKKYPLTELLDEPDTNRLARNQSIDKTIVHTKQINRTKGVSVAFGGDSSANRTGDSTSSGDDWNQPDSPYSARYPYNHVTQSESGHVIEIDDTTNAERLHIYHRTGTFVEIDAVGSMVTRVIGNNYHITDCNGFISIKGKANITVDGSCNILVKNNCNIEVDGNLKTHVHGDYELNVAGKIDIAAGKAFTAYTDKDMSIQAKTGISAKSDTTIDVESKTVANIKAGTKLQIGGAIKTSISSPITEAAIVKMNGMSIVPVPPAPTTGATVRDLTPTKSASPSEEQVDPAELNIKSSASTFTKLYLDGVTVENAKVIEGNNKIIATERAADPPVAPKTPPLASPSVKGAVPRPEPPASRDMKLLAPEFAQRVERILARIPTAMVTEGYRSVARSDWLYGFGRDYTEPGRMTTVSNAKGGTSWHNYGLAVDIIHKTLQWGAPAAWWENLGKIATEEGCEWGGYWAFKDLPHVQWKGLSRSPTQIAKVALKEDSLKTYWTSIRASV